MKTPINLPVIAQWKVLHRDLKNKIEITEIQSTGLFVAQINEKLVETVDTIQVGESNVVLNNTVLFDSYAVGTTRIWLNRKSITFGYIYLEQYMYHQLDEPFEQISGYENIPDYRELDEK